MNIRNIQLFLLNFIGILGIFWAYFFVFSRSGAPFGTLAPSIGGQGPTLGIAFGTFFFFSENTRF